VIPPQKPHPRTILPRELSSYKII